jgi:hypothetical protein
VAGVSDRPGDLVPRSAVEPEARDENYFHGSKE